MHTLKTSLTRRDLLGAAAGAAGTVAVAACAGNQANAAEATPAVPGTRYTTYANVDEIGIVHDAAATEEADVVIAGTGIGGLICAMIVAEQAPDAKVLVAEARGFCGGGTNFAEQNDLPAASLEWEDALREGDATAADSHYIKDGRLYAEKAHEQGENTAWMYLKHQLVFTSDVVPFYEGGNGSKTIQRLLDEIANDDAYANIEVRLNTRATALLLEDEYTCTGVQVKDQNGGDYTNVNAKAVVLFTGGMSNNLDLLKYYTNQDVEKLECEDQGHFGDGMLMAEQTAHGLCKTIALSSMMGYVPGLAYTSNLNAGVAQNPTCCFVNQYGTRFTREDVEHIDSGDISYFVHYSKLIEGQGKVFSIVGQNLLNYIGAGSVKHKGGFYGPSNDPEWTPEAELAENGSNENIFKADTLEELAELIGVPAENLVETVNRYDADCAAGADTLFEKDPAFMVALGEGPYYAFRLKSFLVNTNNGIRVNYKCQVVDPSYEPIAGLYAGGIAISGFNDDVYHTGLCQNVSIWSGSKAARTIVEENLGGTVAEDWFGSKPYTEDCADELVREDWRKLNFDLNTIRE